MHSQTQCKYVYLNCNSETHELHIKHNYVYIYHAAAAEHNQETTNGASRSNHPGETNEQNNAENVLNAWQEDADQGTCKF